MKARVKGRATAAPATRLARSIRKIRNRLRWTAASTGHCHSARRRDPCAALHRPPERHHIGPAAAQMRSGIDWIQLNGDLRKLKRRFCLAEIPLQARMYEMFNVIHLHKTAVARR